MTDYTQHFIDEERLELKLYKCTEGKLTIGVGHNLEAKGISKAVAMLMLKEDMAEAEGDAMAVVPTFNELSDARKTVLVSMAFQMGRDGLRDFKNMLRAIELKEWEIAADEMLDSLWAVQTPNRANRLIEMMRNET